MQMSTLYGVKNFQSFGNLWCVRTDKGVEPVQTFCEQGEGGSILCDFVQKSFMDDPLCVVTHLTMMMTMH